MMLKIRCRFICTFIITKDALHSTVFISFAKQQKQKQMHEKKVHVLKSNNHYFRREKQCTHEKLYTNPVLVSLKKVIHKSIPVHRIKFIDEMFMVQKSHIAICAYSIFAALMVWLTALISPCLTVIVWRWIWNYDTKKMRNFIDSLIAKRHKILSYSITLQIAIFAWIQQTICKWWCVLNSRRASRPTRPHRRSRP